MSHRAITILILSMSVAAGSVGAYPQGKRGPVRASAAAKASQFRSMTAHELELLLSDIASKNPRAIERLTRDADFRHSQIENLKGLLAFASQAEKDGLAVDAVNKQELENIRNEIIASTYDRETQKGKPAFSTISNQRLTQFWTVKTHDADFERFLNAKIRILKASNPGFADQAISKDERDQAREFYAKTQISVGDYESAKLKGRLDRALIERIGLQVKLQQAQFLAKTFGAKNVNKTTASPGEIAAYIAAHPELSPVSKRAAAQKLLDRAKTGEDFAKLADEYSEDPGNVGQDGTKQGGSYKDVPLGRMVKPFESAAIALEPGQIAPTLVESDFGYHVIKLDRKGEKDGKMTYDVRHILIGTTVPDPQNPTARPLPLDQYARTQVESDKEQKFIDSLIASNNISIPDDFVIPPPASVGTPQKRVVKRKR